MAILKKTGITPRLLDHTPFWDKLRIAKERLAAYRKRYKPLVIGDERVTNVTRPGDEDEQKPKP